jgi:hypothetical protein
MKKICWGVLFFCCLSYGYATDGLTTDYDIESATASSTLTDSQDSYPASNLQEIVSDDDINTGNKKYAVLYYCYQIYDDVDYVKSVFERIEAIEPYSRIALVQAYREYQGDDIIYYFSGDCIVSSTQCGNRVTRIRLTDKITGDETKDELVTDLTLGYTKFWSYEDIIETGHDHIGGEYKIWKRYEIGKAEFFMEIFKTDYYNARNELLNIEYIDDLRDFY